jgi:outer membrane protein assembly factor BamB
MDTFVSRFVWSLLVVFVTSAGAAPTAEWPCWRGPNRDGLSAETGWNATWGENGPKELWRVSVGIGFSSCSISGGRVFTMGNKDEIDTVWCLDADTGRPVWTHTYPCRLGKYPGTRMTPTVDGDRVYTLSREGHLFCLDKENGSVRWSHTVNEAFGVRQTRYNWGYACSPLVLGKLLILDLGKTLALDKMTGKLVWSSGDEAAGFSSPTTITVDGTTYINSFNAYGLVLVNAADGKELGRHRWKTNYEINAASPIPHNDKVFISSGYGRGCGLLQVSPSGLKLLYDNENMCNHCNSCVLYQGHLYGLDGQMGSRGRLSCLDFATGEVKWSQRGMRVGGMMIAGGKIVALLDRGELVVAEATPEAYNEISRTEVFDRHQCWTYPVVCGGRIYCRSNKQGELVCLDVSG